MYGRSPTTVRRVRQLLVLAGVLFCALAAKLWYLQILRGELYHSLAHRNRLRTVSETCAPRGIIYDRRGEDSGILATNVQRHSIAVLPHVVRERPESLQRLARILGRAPGEIRQTLSKKGRRPYVPVTIALGVDRERLCLVEENRSRLPGVIVRSAPIRYYRGCKLASHILGHVGEINEPELARVKHDQRFVVGTVTGKTGVEKQYDWYLTGHQAQEHLLVDARGQVRQKLGERSGVPGASLFLTVDRQLQHKCENFLEAAGKPGAIVVMGAQDGEILALASNPDFDPNTFSDTLPKAEWDRLSNDPEDPLQNRAISSRYPPGSTFKLISAAGGLHFGEIPRTRIHCPGSMKIGDRVFRCW